MPNPFSTIFVVVATTLAAVEDSILYGLPLYLLALVNEGLRAWALRGDDVE